MKKDNIEHIFKRLHGQLDIEKPSIKHKSNFIAKLEAQNKKNKIVQQKPSYWKPLIGIAASIILLVTLVFNIKTTTG